MKPENNRFGGMKIVEAEKEVETPEEKRRQEEAVADFLNGLKKEDVLPSEDMPKE